MSGTKRQRELYFAHAHDAPPVIDLGKYYDVKEITRKLNEYGHSKQEIKKITKEGFK
jgi:hypothetical protein